MSDRLRELRVKRGRTITQMRALVDGATGRDFTAEESTQYNGLEAEHDRLKTQIDREKKVTDLERAVMLGEARPGARIEPDEGTDRQAAAPVPYYATPAYRKAFEQHLIHGRDVSPKYLAALQTDSDPAGGYLVLPQEMSNNLIQAIDNEVFIRRLATIERVAQAQSLGRPSLDNDPADADWTSEIATGAEDTAMSMGKRELHPHPLAKRIKVSRKLLRLTSGGAESLVTRRLAYKFGVTEEKGFLTGDGASKPLGVFTPSTNGISTARDVSTGNTTTAILADNLFEVKYSCKAGYQQRGVWIFHRDAVKQIRKLKDSTNQYLWQPGLSGGQPDRILDRPFFMSEYAPNTFTTGLYVGIFGDFSYYWVAEAMSFDLQRLNELYAETNQVGYIGRQEVDAMPVLEEAFARVKLA